MALCDQVDAVRDSKAKRWCVGLTYQLRVDDLELASFVDDAGGQDGIYEDW